MSSLVKIQNRNHIFSTVPSFSKLSVFFMSVSFKCCSNQNALLYTSVKNPVGYIFKNVSYWFLQCLILELRLDLGLLMFLYVKAHGAYLAPSGAKS